MKKVLLSIAVGWLLSCCSASENDAEVLYYPSGEVKEIISRGSARDIKCHKAFLQDGTLDKEYCTLKGKTHGMVRFFFPDGTIQQTMPYENGLRNGIAKNFYPDGQLMESAEFKNDLQHGIHKYYLSNGKLRAIHVFHEGTARYKKIYNYNEMDSLVSVEENMTLIALIDDTVKVNEPFSFTLMLPEGIARLMRTDNFSVKYDIVERSEIFQEKGYPLPIYDIAIVDGMARDSGKMKYVGAYTIHGYIRDVQEGMGQPKHLGSFEKHFVVIGEKSEM
jgi:hypothetical protein